MLKQGSRFRDSYSILVSAVLALLFIALLAYQAAAAPGAGIGTMARSKWGQRRFIVIEKMVS